MNNISYCKWFKKIIAIFIELFFFFTAISSLYVFSTPFKGVTKYIVFVLLLIVLILTTLFFKNKIVDFLGNIIKKLNGFSNRKMIIIIITMLIILKVIYTTLFYFDPTAAGDIKIYNDLANSIIANHKIDSNEVSHLIGLSLHLSLFKIIKLPLHIGIFIVFSIGTIINYFAFKEVIGKGKTFILVILYLLMPSTMLLTFCPTHELFVYLYYSLFGFVFSKFINTDKLVAKVIYSFILLVTCLLCVMVNPAGYILLIVLILSIVLSNLKTIKKIMLIGVVLLTVVSNSAITNSFDFDQTQTDINTYSILIHGSNIISNGEQLDGYPKDQAIEYIHSRGMHISDETMLIGMKGVLKEQYIYLLSHPIELIKLLAHKFYIYWAGDFYSIEMAYTYNAINQFIYYGMLGISTLIYLFIILIGLVFYKKKEDNIIVSNYKLMLLGVVAMLLISLVLNKYSVYMTIFIFFISFYRIKDNEN